MQPRWYQLESRRKGTKKKGTVSGEVQLQLTLADSSDPTAAPQEILQKLASLITISPDEDTSDEEDLSKTDSQDLEDEDEEDEDDIDEKNPEMSDETDNASRPEKAEKRKRKLRMKRLKKKAKARAYEFTGGSNVVGVIFLEIGKITDLPPERNSKA